MAGDVAPLQTTLWAVDDPEVDDGRPPERVELGRGAWVDHSPGWVRGADRLFEACLERFPWHDGEQWMYDRVVAMPRRWAELRPEDDAWLPVMSDITASLGRRYDETFTSCGANLYRDGADSVAWHGDRVGRDRLTSLVAIVSVGAVRRLLLRPKGGGPSHAFDLGPGDLLVMGGTCQRTWEHSVPKRARAGPRISLTFRPWEAAVRGTVTLSPATGAAEPHDRPTDPAGSVGRHVTQDRGRAHE